MNPIERLREEVKRLRSDCKVEFFSPKESDEDDIWRIWVFIGGRCLIATWRPSGEYGINVSYFDERNDPPKNPLIYSDEEKWRSIFLKAVSS